MAVVPSLASLCLAEIHSRWPHQARIMCRRRIGEEGYSNIKRQINYCKPYELRAPSHYTTAKLTTYYKRAPALLNTSGYRHIKITVCKKHRPWKIEPIDYNARYYRSDHTSVTTGSTTTHYVSRSLIKVENSTLHRHKGKCCDDSCVKFSAGLRRHQARQEDNQ